MKNFLIFIAGITIGAGVSWVYHKNKYETMVQEEVDSLRQHAKKKEDSGENKKMSQEDLDGENEEAKNYYEEQIEEVEEIVKSNNYTSSDEEENMADKYKKPFIVTPDDFASLPGFDTDTFYYHHDDIIANDNRKMVDNVEHLLGLTISEIKEQFGVYENDAVYVRNMRLKTDYEILRDEDDFLIRNGD